METINYFFAPADVAVFVVEELADGHSWVLWTWLALVVLRAGLTLVAGDLVEVAATAAYAAVPAAAVAGSFTLVLAGFYLLQVLVTAAVLLLSAVFVADRVAARRPARRRSSVG